MKTNKIFSFKNIAMAAACLLITVGSAQTANAQETADVSKYTTEQVVTVGDTVKINPDSLHYLTGERMSKWVYKTNHVVRQVGTKRFPTGVLLKGIISWVNSHALIPVSIAAPAIVEEKPVEEVVEVVVVEEPAPVVENTDSIKKALQEIEVEQTTTYEIPVSYQIDRFSIGVRGGVASTLVNGFPLGGDVLLDLQYAHYWVAKQDAIALGILTGLSAGYVNANQKETAIDDKFKSGDIDYHVTGKAKETLHQVLLEVPVMFSMVTPKGFYLNAGPKLLIPMATTFKQTMSDAQILAYDPVLNGKPLKDNPVYGQFAESQLNGYKGKLGAAGKVAIGLAAEAGYEFRSGLAIGGYVGCTLYSAYSGVEAKPLVDIVAPTSADRGQVVVNSLTQANPKGFGLFDLGVKISYNLDFDK